MIILSLIPVGCGLALWLAKPFLESEGITLFSLFPKFTFFMFLHFLLPLMAVFIGTAVIGDVVDDRTLPYLMVRPIPRRSIILSKILAGVVTLAVILFVSLGLTYSVLVLSEGISGWLSNFVQLLHGVAIVVLGLLVYVPLFGFFGGTIKRPVLAGLFFTFGWESTVAFFPGNVKLFSIAHYLHILSPKLQRVRVGSGRSALLEFVMPAKQISPVTAILVLIILIAVFMGLTISLLYIKEYRLEQGGG